MSSRPINPEEQTKQPIQIRKTKQEKKREKQIWLDNRKQKEREQKFRENNKPIDESIVNKLLISRLPLTITLSTKIQIIVFDFYLFGSKVHSQDADIAVSIKIRDIDDDNWNNFSEKEKNELLLILKEYIFKSKIETVKDIDLCLFELDIENRCIKWCSKGPNMNLQYYLYHTSDKSICLDEPLIETMDMGKQVSQISTLTLKELRSLYSTTDEEYSRIHPDSIKKREAFNNKKIGHKATCEFGIQMLKKFIMTKSNKLVLKKGKSIMIEFWKKITVKIIQSYLFDINYSKNQSIGNIFTKVKMIERFSELLPDHEIGISKLLYRDKEVQTDTIYFLLEIYKKLVEKYIDITPILTIHIPPNTITSNDDLMKDLSVDESILWPFIESPNEATDKFCENWSKANGDRNINSVFEEIGENISYLDSPNQAKCYKHLIIKSPEWIDIKSKYKCGRNSGIPPIPKDSTAIDIIKLRYNLIRGCIGEEIVLSYIKNGLLLPIFGMNYITMIIPLIVEKKYNYNSFGCAPDAIIRLMYGWGKLIPIEIKTIYGMPSRNVSFSHAKAMADKQVNTCKKIIGTQESYMNTNKYQIIFMSIVIISILYQLFINTYYIHGSILILFILIISSYIRYLDILISNIDGLSIILWIHESQLIIEVFSNL